MRKILFILLILLPGISSAQNGSYSNDTTEKVHKMSALENVVFEDLSEAQMAQVQWAMLGMHRQTSAANVLLITGAVLSVGIAVTAGTVPLFLLVASGSCTFLGVILSLNSTKWYKRAAAIPIELPNNSGYKIRKRA